MCKTIQKLILGVVIAVLGFAIGANAAGPGPNHGGQKNLTDGDEAHLIFMRSEEKLARDVYLTLGELFPQAPVFKNIACVAEQTHTEQISTLLDDFNIEDPEPAAVYEEDCDLIDDETIGVFQTDAVYYEDLNEYFGGKFDDLTDLDPDDPASLLAALKIGAKIEELDMKDINVCNSAINPDPDYCGLIVTEVKSIENTLTSLLEGSKNHLCAFVGQILPLNNGCYRSQIIDETEVGDIIAANCPELFDAWGYDKTVCDYTYEP